MQPRQELVRISSANRQNIVLNSSRYRHFLVIFGRRFSPNLLIRNDSQPGNFPVYRHFSSFLVIFGRKQLN